MGFKGRHMGVSSSGAGHTCWGGSLFRPWHPLTGRYPPVYREAGNAPCGKTREKTSGIGLQDNGQLPRILLFSAPALENNCPCPPG